MKENINKNNMIFEEVEELVNKNNGKISLNSWVRDDEIVRLYWIFKNENKEINFFKTKNGKYIVYHTKGTDGQGMSMGTPDCIVIEKIIEKKS